MISNSTINSNMNNNDMSIEKRVFGKVLTNNDTNIQSPQRQHRSKESYKQILSPSNDFLKKSSSSNNSLIERNHNDISLNVSSSSISPMRRIALNNQQLLDQPKPSSFSSPQYSITFPPGPMGLELEPVIISSEREIGCRVKDFYFGVDHDGINEDYVLKNIAVGDIISCISGQVVLSSKFSDILDILRSLKGSSRTIIFKNISASWNTNSQKLEKSHVVYSPKLSKAIVPIDRNQKNSSNQMLPMKPTTASSPLMRSPLVTNSSYDKDVSISFSREQPSDSSLLVSPKAVREMSLSKASKLSSCYAAQSPVRTVQSLDETTTIPLISVDLKRVLGTIGSSIGASILTIGNALGSVIGEHAERVVLNTAEKIPRYNMNEMDQVVMKKQKLLNELSESCFLLGAAEESKQSLSSQVEELKSKELEITANLNTALKKLELLENENHLLKSEKTEMSSNLQSIQSELVSVKTEFTSVAEAHAKASLEIIDLSADANYKQQQLNDLTESLTSKDQALQQALSDLAAEMSARSMEQRNFQYDIERALTEQQNLRAELESTFEKANSQLELVENARDTALVELEVMRDSVQTDKAAYEAEQQRARENLKAQQELYKEQLLQKEEDIFLQRKEITDLKNVVAELKKFKSDAEVFKVEMNNKINDTICELAAKDEELREVKLKFAVESPKKIKMTEDMDCLRENLLSLADRSAQLENHVQLLEQKNNILEGEIDGLNYIITECKEENLKLMALVDTSSLKANTLAEELLLSGEQVKTLEETIMLNSEEIKRISEEKQELEQQLVKVTHDLESTTGQWNEQLQISSVFEEKLKDHQEYICHLENDRSNLRKEIETELHNYKHLEDEIDAYKNHMGVLERRLEERDLSIAELNTKLDDACLQHQEFLNQIDQLMKQKVDIDLTLQNLKKESEMNKNEANIVREKLHVANVKNNQLEIDFLKAVAMSEETHDGIRKDLEIKIAQLEVENASLLKAADWNASEIQRLTDLNNDTQTFAENELAKASNDLMSASCVMDEMKITISKQEQIIKSEADKNDTLNKSLATLTEQLSKVNDKLVMSIDSYNIVVSSRDQLESNIKELRSKIVTTEIEKAKFSNNCSSQCELSFDCTGSLRTELAEARIDISNLMDLNSQMSKVAIDSLAKSNIKVNELCAKVKLLESQKEEVILKLQMAEQSGAEALERYNLSISKIIDIEKSKDGAIDEIASLHKQLNDSVQLHIKAQADLQLSEEKSLTIIQDFNCETAKLKEYYESIIQNLENDLVKSDNYFKETLAEKDKLFDELNFNSNTEYEKLQNATALDNARLKEETAALSKQLIDLSAKNQELKAQVTEASNVINEQLDLLQVAEEAYNNKHRELQMVQQVTDSSTSSNLTIVDLERSLSAAEEKLSNSNRVIHELNERYDKTVLELEQSQHMEAILRTKISDQETIISNMKADNELKDKDIFEQGQLLRLNIKEIESFKKTIQESLMNKYVDDENVNHDILNLREQLSESQQNNTYLKNQLGDILVALDAQALALKEAEIREYEHNSTIKYLERLVLEAGIIAKRNSDIDTIDSDENKENMLNLFSQLKTANDSLIELQSRYDKKCEEHDALSTQVIELLKSSYTPMKPPNAQKVAIDLKSVSFKKYVDYKKIQSRIVERAPLGDITDHNIMDCSDDDEIEYDDEKDLLVALVIELHDLIGSAVMFLAKVPHDNFDMKSKILSMWYGIGNKVQELHQLVLHSNEQSLPCIKQIASSMLLDNEISNYDDSHIDDSLEGAFTNNENLAPIKEIINSRCKCPVGKQLDMQDRAGFHPINDGIYDEKNLLQQSQQSLHSIISCASVDRSIFNRHNNIEDDDTVRLSTNFFLESEVKDNIDNESQPEGEESFWNVSTETEQSSFCSNL